MRTIVPLIALGAAGALAGCTTPPTPAQQAARADREARLDAELAEALEGYVAAEPVDCLPSTLQQSRASTTRIGGRTILYQLDSNTIYRNDPPGGCGGGGLNTVIVTQTPTGRSCRGDIVRVVDPLNGFQVGGCALGPFVPYRRTDTAG